MIDLILLAYCINQTALGNVSSFWDLVNYLNSGNQCLPNQLLGLSIYAVIVLTVIISIALHHGFYPSLLAGSFIGIVLGLGLLALGLITWDNLLVLLAINFVILILLLIYGGGF